MCHQRDQISWEGPLQSTILHPRVLTPLLRVSPLRRYRWSLSVTSMGVASPSMVDIGKATWRVTSGLNMECAACYTFAKIPVVTEISRDRMRGSSITENIIRIWRQGGRASPTAASRERLFQSTTHDMTRTAVKEEEEQEGKSTKVSRTLGCCCA